MKEQPYQLRGGPLPLRENDVEQACIDLLGYAGYWWERLHVGRYRTPDLKRWITCADEGTPDYVVGRGHRMFLMEVKRPRKKPSKLQRKKIEILGGLYGLPVVTVDTVEKLVEWLKDFECRYGRWEPDGRKIQF